MRSYDTVGQRLVEAPGTIGRSMVLVWWIGVMTGLMGALLRDAPQMSYVSKCEALWLVLSNEDGLPS